MAIDKKSIEELKQKADIVDVISSYVEVRKSGASFVCVCPFHDDRNPSMHINALKGFYHCFSCKAGGDVFKFVQDIERLSFNEAVEKVASICRFTLTYTKQKQDFNKGIYEVLPLLHTFYKQNLAKNKEALDYLYSRSLNDEDIAKFELGFAPSSDESLRLLRNEKIELKNALESGAVKFNAQQNNHYASFIQRITFPIYDYKHLLVGFGGRTLDENNKAKYVNSPQSRLFDKSRIFYAFHLAKEVIAKEKEMIVCEGYMDAIAFHKAGLNNAVAVLGTALTEYHLPLIKRYEARVILCFDSDEAGKNAALRSAFLLSTHKIDGKVVFLQGGKDAAELVKEGKHKMLFDSLEKGIELGEFYIRELIAGFDLNSALNKQLALEAVQKYTFMLEPLIANSYSSLVAKLLGVSENFISLSKEGKKMPAQNFMSLPQNTVNLAEFELLDFLRTNEKARALFPKISDKACFKHKSLLEKILANVGLEDSEVRELEFAYFQKLSHENEFLFGIAKLNLAFLNHIHISNINLAFKKQLFSLLNKNELSLNKILSQKDLRAFLEYILIFIKTEQSEERLELVFQRLSKVFVQSSFSLETLLGQDDESPF